MILLVDWYDCERCKLCCKLFVHAKSFLFSVFCCWYYVGIHNHIFSWVRVFDDCILSSENLDFGFFSYAPLYIWLMICVCVNSFNQIEEYDLHEVTDFISLWQNESNGKRTKVSESIDQNGGLKSEAETNSGSSSKPVEEKSKPEPPKDYIHVRARRGQATDSHSLAERVVLASLIWDMMSTCLLVFRFWYLLLISGSEGKDQWEDETLTRFGTRM